MPVRREELPYQLPGGKLATSHDILKYAVRVLWNPLSLPLLSVLGRGHLVKKQRVIVPHGQ